MARLLNVSALSADHLTRPLVCHASPFQAAGLERVTKRRLLLACLLLSGVIYFLRGRKGAVLNTPALTPLPESEEGALSSEDERDEDSPVLLNMTSWSAPVVWGDSAVSEWRRREFSNTAFRVGLAVFVVGRYSQYLPHFIASAEHYFMRGDAVIYYILTDNLRNVPTLQLGSGRRMRALQVTEMPQWDRLSRVRMSLLASAIKEQIQREVEYVFCMDVDQEFVNPVGTEILGELVATLHPEYYGMPLYTYPYEKAEVSLAFVEEGEGDFYYTSELYGGLCSEVYALTRACSQFILQDSEASFHALQYEESYLNRYLINRRPTCVLSPEYSWWDSPRSPEVPVQRIVSLGRECASLEPQKRAARRC
ncbi:globoside alpha-1,3-N-acetylgalactosaminyltransferase 1-like [Megalops cyprinoides]|uniref:globoside alpha-1,3-N-acetylgalactosaminyltransferase 1-like n=1 Tax=Megalops cyprinoides TaxID=118141 RepID=UPI001864B756|nr:globoside alpha-1,3-N-acetylgalactosaminyltransferase 1-like [Megalops cyprinoides]